MDQLIDQIGILEPNIKVQVGPYGAGQKFRTFNVINFL